MSFTFSKNVEFRSAGLFSTFKVCPSCSSIRRCSRDTFAGITTRMLMYKSPRPPCGLGKPLPFLRKICPDCVPSGISNSSSPFKVATRILSPSAACEKLTGISQIKSDPRRSKKLCSFTSRKNERAPAPPAVRSRLPLPRHPQTRPGIHTRRHSHFQGAFALNPPHSAATDASILDRLPRSLAGRASPRDGKKSLRISHLPAPAARMAGSHARARLRARPFACLAKFVPCQLNLASDARRSFFERKRHVVTQIRPALPPPRATSAAPPPSAQHFIKPKKIAENILKFLEDR